MADNGQLDRMQAQMDRMEARLIDIQNQLRGQRTSPALVEPVVAQPPPTLRGAVPGSMRTFDDEEARSRREAVMEAEARAERQREEQRASDDAAAERDRQLQEQRALAEARAAEARAAAERLAREREEAARKERLRREAEERKKQEEIQRKRDELEKHRKNILGDLLDNDDDETAKSDSLFGNSAKRDTGGLFD